MGYKTLSDEKLIDIYLKAYGQKLDACFLEILLDEIITRGIIFNLFLETDKKSFL